MSIRLAIIPPSRLLVSFCLGFSTFRSCSKLEMIECYAVEPPTASGISGNYNTTLICVPGQSVDAYKVANGWKGFSYIFALDGTEPEEETCEAPTITYSNGELQFTSATEGAEYHYTDDSGVMVPAVAE